MAEGITLKRIIDMDEATELSSSDYALVDSATGGPKKFALGEELSSLKEDYSDILNSAYVTDTASGAIASFQDGADNVPVTSLKVNIEPVQDLHGQANPYPAGGGANQFDALTWGALGNNANFYSVANDETITVTANDTAGIGARLFDIEANATYSVRAIGFTEIKVFNSASSSVISKSSGTFTAPSDGKIAIKCYASSYPTSGKIILVKGSTIPTAWSPYENICPISGHTQAVVTRTGVNLFDPSSVVTGQFNADGNVVTSPTRRVSDYIRITPGASYYVHDVISSSAGRGSYFYDKYKNPTHGGAITGLSSATEGIIQSSSTDYYIRIGCVAENLNTCYINNTADDTEYHAYNGQTVTIDLNGTIYGGTLDVGTGVLTVDRQIVDLGTLNWTQSNTTAGALYPHRWLSNAVSNMSGSATTANGLCNKYKTVPYSGGSADPNVILNGQRDCVCSSEARGYINVIDSAKDSLTPAQFKSAMDGTYIVYKLANPFEVTLTANEITTLLGQNNIWNDCGDTEVEYRADTKLYIEKLTAPTEDDMVADHAISANSFFMIGNTLYRATTAIASGATITVGTNATKLSLSDALNALA